MSTQQLSYSAQIPPGDTKLSIELLLVRQMLEEYRKALEGLNAHSAQTLEKLRMLEDEEHLNKNA
jgi:hypothetical protein